MSFPARIVPLVLIAVFGAAVAVGAAPAPPLLGANARIAAAEARVAAIGYRLATRNARWCPERAPQLGMIWGDRRLYPAGGWAAARATYRASDADSPFVAALVARGPAAVAGLKVGDAVEPGDEAVLSASASLPHARVDAAERWVAGHGSADGLRLRVNGSMRHIDVATGCRSDFRVEASSGFGAAADGRVVKIPAGLVERFPDDGQLAAAIAHEMAHNILHHRARLDAAGVPADRKRLSTRDKAKIRTTEVEADRLSVWLLAGAGYAPDAVIPFWEGLARAKGPLFFPADTHPPRSERRRTLAAEIAAMTAARARDANVAPPMIANPAPLD